jgi:hypothetical protein
MCFEPVTTYTAVILLEALVLLPDHRSRNLATSRHTRLLAALAAEISFDGCFSPFENPFLQL